MIMVSSAAAIGGRRQLVAVVVTVAKGYDLDYIWKTQGQRGAERTSGGYYIDAAQAGGPPGRWWGPGAEALGFTAGQRARAQAVRRGVPASRPTARAKARQAPREVHRIRRPSGAADG